MAYTLGEIAKHIDAELSGDPICQIFNVNTLNQAKEGEISFLANRRYVKQLSETKATAVILRPEDIESCPAYTLATNDPHLGFANIVRLLHPVPKFEPGINKTAKVSSSAIVDPSCAIGANVIVDDKTVIKSNVSIGPGCVIGKNLSIGSDTRLLANIVLCDHVTIGERVIIHPGVVIGADGFGLANDHGVWLKIPQLGSVIIGDDVEIGANTTIDRGAIGTTVIEDGVKIDNQVQIGHNVCIGAHTAIAGCVGIAGSTSIGKRCMIGGAAAINGHIDIIDDVIITAMSGVANSIKEPGMYSSGMPATSALEWRKNMASLKKLYKLNKRINNLEKKQED